MLSENLPAFFKEYAVLARLSVRIMAFWVDSSREFLQRLAQDLPLIQHTFHLSAPGRVEALKPALSDPHHQGRSVMGVKFESGFKLIYKPKDVAAEAHYFKLLEWVNAQQVCLPFRTLEVIPRGAYGWVEYADTFACQHVEELKRYYQRCGALLALLYALRGTDFHFENVLACGDQPLLVDLETLFHPVLSPTAQSRHQQKTATQLAVQQLNNSVLATALLPTWYRTPAEQILDVSGIGAVVEQEIESTMLANVNTDQMGVVQGSRKVSVGESSPFGRQTPTTFDAYIEEVVDGFRQMYQFLLTHRQTLLAPNGLLAACAQGPFRFLVRNTELYATLLLNSLRPSACRQGVERSIELDALSRAWLQSDAPPPLWPTVAAERRALEQADVPCFTFHADRTAVVANGDPPSPRAFTEPPYATVRQRLQGMGPEDLAQQIDIIRGALYTRTLAPSPVETSHGACQPATPRPRDHLIAHAISIGDTLLQRAIDAPDGSVCWLGMHYDTRANRHGYQPLEYGLYNGSAGVALFLTALSTLTGQERFRAAALCAFHSWQGTMATATAAERARLIKAMGLGAGDGLASLAYALATGSQLLDEPGLLHLARQTAAGLTADHLQADAPVDLLDGAAGAILGLLKVYHLSGAATVLDTAVAAGQQLVEHRRVSDEGYCTWKTAYPKMLTGLAQGASGIAYALLRLFETTGNVVYQEVARQALAYEQTAFCAQAGNWYDFRPAASDGEPACVTRWCHGAAGIGLARVAGLGGLDTEAIRHDLDVALQTTERVGVQGVDHLCCGTMGRVDVLLTAARRLGRASWLEAAQRLTAGVLERARCTGAFQLYPNVPSDVYNPSFFRGMAGIGYGLLRVAEPDALPCVLIWE
jgi:type 2 lantibiotic biosynthesis protein LanM